MKLKPPVKAKWLTVVTLAVKRYIGLMVCNFHSTRYYDDEKTGSVPRVIPEITAQF
jgi:hypothetical protein